MAATQVGTSLSVGFGTNVYGAHLMQSFSKEAIDDVEVVKDSDGATETKILKDPGYRITFSCSVVGALIDPPAVGASITVNAVKYFCESASVAQSTGASILTVTAVKETSMTYA